MNAYKRSGNGARLTPARTARIFVLAAILYVDDTDLLHWAESKHSSVEELIEQMQNETTQWGMLAQSTGGYSKRLSVQTTSFAQNSTEENHS